MTKQHFLRSVSVAKILAVIFYLAACTFTDSQVKNGESAAAGAEEAAPEENRFTVEVLAQKFYEPMQLAITSEEKVIVAERLGAVKLYDPAEKTVKNIGKLDVFTGSEDGLLALALDPAFEENGWIYFFYSPAGVDSVNRVSRFRMLGDSLDPASGKLVIDIPVIRACCHAGGSLEFGPDGSLFISTGDNTNPSASDGYAPLDERVGRISYDAQKSAANTHDLRGKILRIKPRPEGGYSIPDDNLFPRDGSKGRPEIYVMGNRNPYRISVDRKTGYLYWGEVGPDAGRDSSGRGPMGYDEINQARGPGNFGWPYFIADNKPYQDFDFATNVSGKSFDPQAPVNTSVNNTGAKALPPARPAFIWYPYSESPDFPEVNKGGRTAMAGPVFYREHFRNASHPFPPYYDGKLFIYDWMRDWIMTVTMDAQGNFMKLEPFLPSVKFSKPVDMQFGPDGSLYVLEYGTFWKSLNDNSRLVKIKYYENNRKPAAIISAGKTAGGVPLKVRFSAERSFDYDKGDELKYSWRSSDGAVRQGMNPEFIFDEPGIYEVTLTVTDKEGESATASLTVSAGNEPPVISIETSANRSFYWNGQPIPYKIKVTDKEDGTIEQGQGDAGAVKAFFEYLPEGKDLALLGSAENSGPAAGLKGRTLVSNSDCAACHALDKRSVGPSFREVARRYKNKDVREILADKIRNGGSGNWGETPMSAHPQVSKADALEMAGYILGLADTARAGAIPLSGELSPARHRGTEGTYFLSVAYTDKGANGIGPLTSRESIVLRHPEIRAVDCDSSSGVMMRQAEGKARFTQSNGFIAFKSIDLTRIRNLIVQAYAYADIAGTLEVRLGAENGRLISSKFLDPGQRATDFSFPLKPAEGFHDIFLVYKTDSERIGIWYTFDITKVTFSR